MNEPELRFNALTDPWLPLTQPDGSVRWASFVSLLAGEVDGVDLDYPRDDFRVYARLLLSALVQALFPAKDKAELEKRLTTPLPRDEVERRIAPVLGDFDLFGPTPFLQILRPASPPDKGAAPFVFPTEDLFVSLTPPDAVSLPIACVTIFVEQTYAGGAGRGYGAGPAGQPGAFTLIDPGTVRQAAWANTLTVDRLERQYAKEDTKPWSNAKRAASPRAAIGLVTGLFFQPRSIWLEPAGLGRCSVTGAEGPVVRRSPYLPKSELTKKPNGKEDLWQHPCAPLAVNSAGIGAIRLNAERPAWTGLAQLLSPISRGARPRSHPNEGPAPVLQQWLTLTGRTKRPKLIVLDFDRDKANVRRRFFESIPLSDALLKNKEVLEQLRALIRSAEDVQRALVGALKSAHDSQKRGGLAMVDAVSAYWTATEPPFLDWLVLVSGADEWSDEADAHAQAARAQAHRAFCRSAIEVFNAHVEMSEFDLRKQTLVAKARKRLLRELFPRPTSTTQTSAEARS